MVLGENSRSGLGPVTPMDVVVVESPLLVWCTQHNLGSVASKLETKCGLTDPKEFADLSHADIDALIATCDLNFGERARFRSAINSLPKPKFSSGNLQPLLEVEYDPKILESIRY